MYWHHFLPVDNKFINNMHYRACTGNSLSGHTLGCCGKVFDKTFRNERIIATQSVDGRWHLNRHLFLIFYLSYYMSIAHFYFGTIPKPLAQFFSARASRMPFRQPKIFLDILIHRQWHKVRIRVDTLWKLWY